MSDAIVFVHDGPAHADEMWGCASLHLVQPIGEIRRMSSSAVAEFRRAHDDPAGVYWFIDVGLEYNPNKRLFDHHQFFGEEQNRSALELVVRAMPALSWFYDNCADFAALVKRVSIQDTKGLAVVKEAMAMNPVTADQNVFRGIYMAERALVALFEKDPMTVVRLLSGYLDNLRQMASAAILIQARLQERDWVIQVKAEGDSMIYGVLNATCVDTCYPTRAVNSAINTYMKVRVDKAKAAGEDVVPIHITVTRGPDDSQNPNSLTLFRCPNRTSGKMIDFTRCAHDRRVKFAHSGGFLLVCNDSATTRDIPELVRMAIVPRPTSGCVEV